jgi:hypothetical protein
MKSQGFAGLVTSTVTAAFDRLHRMMRRDFLVSGAISSRINEEDPKKVARWAVQVADEAIRLMDEKKRF